MLPKRMFPRPLLLAVLSVTVATSLATADHVAPSLPLTAGSNHSHEKLDNQVFPTANLMGISLAFADLSGSTFGSGTNLTFASFIGANLRNANLAGANIDGANFQGADLTNATLPCVADADFRGAILTGVTAPGGCVQCQILGSNLQDQCTAGSVPTMCMAMGAFRGAIAGVVYIDANSNNTLDFGEQGVSGVTLNIVLSGGGGGPSTSDSRGSYGFVHNAAVVGSITLDTNTLPGNLTFTGNPVRQFDLSQCRSAQEINYAVTDPTTPTNASTWGRVKVLYR
jgi:hypothetical protein